MNILNRIKTLENKFKEYKKGVLYHIFNNGKLIESNENELNPTELNNATKIIIRRNAI